MRHAYKKNKPRLIILKRWSKGGQKNWLHIWGVMSFSAEEGAQKLIGFYGTRTINGGLKYKSNQKAGTGMR